MATGAKPKRNGKGAAPLGEGARNALYLRSVSLSNIRCFGPEQTLNLEDDEGRPARWTVILADNGAGKTSLLRAILGATPELREVTSSSGRRTQAKPRAPLLGFDFDYLMRLEGGNPEIRASFCRGAAPKSGAGEFHPSIEVSIYEDDTWGWRGDDFDWKSEGCCAVAYGASRSLSDSIRVVSSTRKRAIDPFSEEANLIDAEEWLISLDYRRLRNEQREDRVGFETVREKLLQVLPKVRDFRIVDDGNSPATYELQFKTDFGWIPLDRISHGYRTMFAWMIDFVAKLTEYYPASKEPLSEAAICLIDEIDLHLHPKWQREIIDYLSNIFPNTQFIVTAHSPLVVQSAEHANLAVLRQAQGEDYVTIENDPADVRNWRLDQIYTSDLFDLPSAQPKRYDAVLDEREKILSKKRLTAEDKDRLAELDAEMRDMPVGETRAESEAIAYLLQLAEKNQG